MYPRLLHHEAHVVVDNVREMQVRAIPVDYFVYEILEVADIYERDVVVSLDEDVLWAVPLVGEVVFVEGVPQVRVR